jgi:hypothetical protein
MVDYWFTNITTHVFLPHLRIKLVYVLLRDHKLGDEMRCQGTFRTTNIFGDQ